MPSSSPLLPVHQQDVQGSVSLTHTSPPQTYPPPWPAMLASPKRQTFPLPQLPTSLSSLSPTAMAAMAGALPRQPSEYELAMLESLSATVTPYPPSSSNPSASSSPHHVRSPSGGGGGGSGFGNGSVYAPGYFGQQSQFVNQRYISGRGGGDPAAERKNAIRSLERQARDIVAELQFLVTSQERALNSNKPSANNNNNGYNDGTGSTISNGRAGGGDVYDDVRPQARRKRQLTVRQARDGILDAMQSLLDVREAEETYYGEDVGIREGLIEQVSKWVEKRARLEKEVERIENGKEGKEMEELRVKVEAIQVEINTHEDALKKLRSQQTDLLKQISTIQTTLAARASSYNSAIQTLYKGATNFLQSPNSLLPMQSPKSSVPLTPDAAIDYWSTENKALKDKMDATAKEATALRDGLVLWDECVGMIDRFEMAMAKELAGVVEKNSSASRNLVDLDNDLSFATPTARRSLDKQSGSRPGSSSRVSSGRSTPTSAFANRLPRQGMLSHSRNGSMTSSGSTFKANNGSPSRSPSASHMPDDVAIKLVRGIDKTISKLEGSLNLAEDRGWTLLVCCIGAELDSFREARDALIANTGIDAPSASPPRSSKGKEKEKAETLIPTPEADGVSSPELPMKDPKMQHAGTWETSDAESEIDDPEALFSQPPSSTRDADGDVKHMSLPSPRVRQLRSTEQDELEYAAFASLHQSAPNTSASTFVRRIPADVTYRRPNSATGSSPKKTGQTISPPPPGVRIDPDVLDSPHSAFPPSVTSDVLGSEHSAFPPRRNSAGAVAADVGREREGGAGFGEGSDSTVRRSSVQGSRVVNDDVD